MSSMTGHDFTVHVGLTLPDEAIARITKAIQRAVLLELADTDLPNGYAVGLRAPGSRDDDPKTKVPLGIWIEPQDPTVSDVPV
ncbi:MAG: hypothetical protein ABJA74_17085 [Lapillicoccus sp.]